VVRDLARELGKRARLEIIGETLQVDRDVLERLDAPLMHLLRNALDHGVESPEQRRAAGKPEEGRLQLRASYRTGLLAVELSDDGAGIDFERIRAALLRQGLVDGWQAALLDNEALQDFLFQSGFSTRDAVSEVSGRGVGLDVVRDTLRQLEGSIRISSIRGRGTTFHLLLPISRVVTRAVVVRAAGEAYAFPLLRVDCVLRFERARVADSDGTPYLPHDGRNIGLLALAEHLEVGAGTLAMDSLLAVVLEQESRCLGFVVDEVVGEMDLATRPLDPRLGRVADVAALALLPDGEPVVLLDMDDLMRNALDQQRRASAQAFSGGRHVRRVQTVLVADDSISVRELQRQILSGAGYRVEVAVDGADAWARLRSHDIDLLVTDVDMPRMDGIELTRSVKQDARLRSLPVVIVSYRDRPEDRRRGLDVHADAYVTKGDFQEDGLLRIVRELIGDAEVRG
jgi:two-component system sensor histidine kinase and response regulator WspE